MQSQQRGSLVKWAVWLLYVLQEPDGAAGVLFSAVARTSAADSVGNGSQQPGSTWLQSDALPSPLNDDLPYLSRRGLQQIETFASVAAQAAKAQAESGEDVRLREAAAAAAAAEAASIAAATEASLHSSNTDFRVALLFLVRVDVATEVLWTAFIAAATGLKFTAGAPAAVPPTDPTKPGPGRPPAELLPPVEINQEELGRTCWNHHNSLTGIYNLTELGFRHHDKPNIPLQDWVQTHCNNPVTAEELYQQQELFTIYVHRPPDAPSAGPGSLFHDRDISERTSAAFAQPSLVQATRALLRAALLDPRNQAFVLLSEACIPLYPPPVIYTQLMHEALAQGVSRVAVRDQSNYRWAQQMATDFLREEHFLKGDQWMALNRRHARILGLEQHVWPQFKTWCRTMVHCRASTSPRWPKWGRECVADEHYAATTLAAHGEIFALEQDGESHFVDWKTGGATWHPRTFYGYSPYSSAQVLAEMRGSTNSDNREKCWAEGAQALRTVRALFRRDKQKGAPCEAAQEPPKIEPPGFRSGFYVKPRRQRTARHRPGYAGDSTSMASGEAAGTQGTATSAARGHGVANDLTEEPRSRWFSWGASASLESQPTNTAGERRRQWSIFGKRRRLQESDAEAEEDDWDDFVEDRSIASGARTLEALASTVNDVPADFKPYTGPSWAVEEGLIGQAAWDKYLPMTSDCPLFGRKLSPRSTSAFANVAWSCGALAFSWNCTGHLPKGYILEE